MFLFGRYLEGNPTSIQCLDLNNLDKKWYDLNIPCSFLNRTHDTSCFLFEKEMIINFGSCCGRLTALINVKGEMPISIAE